MKAGSTHGAGQASAPSPLVAGADYVSPAASSYKNEKPAKLNALTGLRFFAALNIVFFHFSNPQWFGPFAPIVDAGYISVSFFILLSGYVLAYNYAERARRGRLDAVGFWKARLSRLYPVYLLSLVLSLGMLRAEYGARTHTVFWIGVTAVPLLLQGWWTPIATFWNTPAWTMSAESFFYLLFPRLAAFKLRSKNQALLLMLMVWGVGLLPGLLYTWLKPDGDPHPGRYTSGFWMQTLKFTPLPHLASFVFGILLAYVDSHLHRAAKLRLALGVLGFGLLYLALYRAPALPYAMLHDGLLMPVFALIVLCLTGHNGFARFFSFPLFVRVGEASYCLYLLHFNLWVLIHESGLLERTGLIRFDPWLSYALLILFALAVLHCIERPLQVLLRRWMMPSQAVHG